MMDSQGTIDARTSMTSMTISEMCTRRRASSAHHPGSSLPQMLRGSANDGTKSANRTIVSRSTSTERHGTEYRTAMGVAGALRPPGIGPG